MKKLYEEQDVQNIADAIRNKSGSSATYKISEMANAIENIPSGGGCDYFAENVVKQSTPTANILLMIYRKLPPLPEGTKVNNMVSMCESNINLVDISLISNWDTSGLTSMQSAFKGCTKLSNINALAYINTSSVYNMINLFNGCSSISDLSPISNWDVSSVTDPPSFAETKITNTDFCKNWHYGSAYAFNSMFNNCSQLAEADMSNMTTNYTGSSGAIYYMFQNCTKLRRVDMKNMVFRIQRLQYMFNGCSSLQFVDIRGLTCSNITGSGYYSNALTSVPKTCKFVVKDETEKTWWQGKFSAWSSCFYTVAEAIEAGIIDE